MTMTKRIFAALLCASSLISCSGGETETTAETTADTAAVETEAETDSLEARKLVDDGLADKDFGGEDVRMLYQERYAEFQYVEEMTGDTLDDAVYNRNMNVEERFNAVIVHNVGAEEQLAMDIKNSIGKYGFTTGVSENDNLTKQIRKSINYLLSDVIDYEFRTTVVPGLITESDIEDIAKNFIPGAKKYYLNQFRPQITLDESFGNLQPYSDDTLQKMANICKNYNIDCHIRAGYSTEGTQHKF